MAGCCGGAGFMLLGAMDDQDGNIVDATLASPCVITVNDSDMVYDKAFQVTIDGVKGSVGDVLNGKTFFCKKSDGEAKFELYADAANKEPVDTSGEGTKWTKYGGGGNAVTNATTDAKDVEVFDVQVGDGKLSSPRVNSALEHW